MNLTERQKEWAKVRDPRVEGSELYCQYGSGFCRERRCVSYDWERDECIHVLAARAQVQAAEAQARIAEIQAEALREITGTDYGAGYKFLRIKGEISKARDY